MAIGVVFAVLSGLFAQPPVDRFLVKGRVIADEGGTPLAGAIARASRAGAQAVSDRFGRFTLRLTEADTIQVSLIGFAPGVAMATEDGPELVFVLRALAVSLPEIAVSADDPRRLASASTLRVNRAALRSLPFTLEPDLLRVLALSPSVSFSSPLSGRPVIRGYDPAESGLTVDGFELVAPYHLARSFFAFPPDAAESVTLQPGPHRAAVGGTLSGIVDVAGRSGADDSANVGAAASLASLSGWTGRSRPSHSWFAAGRLGSLSIANAVVPGTLFPYAFGDLYATASTPRLRLTAFATRDHLGARGSGTGADWGTILLGARSAVVHQSRHALSLAASFTRSSLEAKAISIRSSVIDVANLHRRGVLAIDYRFSDGSFVFESGANVAARRVSNDITVVTAGLFPQRRAILGWTEAAAYAEASLVGSTATGRLGVRFDGGRGAARLQPRGSLSVRLSEHTAASVAVGRTERQFHLVSDDVTEPELDLAEFWLGAGVDGVPTARVDHGSVDVRYAKRGFGLRLSAFVSQGDGLGELATAQSLAFSGETFRFGAARTKGLETQLAIGATGGAGNSLSIAHVLSLSERRFSDRWQPWALDRRHRLRLAGQVLVSRRTALATSFEIASGLPLTPIQQVIYRTAPGAPLPQPTYLLGPENSGRGGATAMLDVAVKREIRWLGGRGWAGLSVANLAFGDVAPSVVDYPPFPVLDRVPYKRLYKLPAVPTMFVELTF